jgi:hypothetical protein
MSENYEITLRDAIGTFDWMWEDATINTIEAEDYIKSYVNSIAWIKIDEAAANGIEITQSEFVEQWLASDEYEEAVEEFKKSQRLEFLDNVMTPAEIEKTFGLADGTVRQAIHQKRFMQFRRPDERTILIHRADAEARWGKVPGLPIDYNWLEQNVVAFISQGGVGHYDVNDMEPSELAEFMIDYWRKTAHEMPDWFDARSRQWCIEQLAESFAADRS